MSYLYKNCGKTKEISQLVNSDILIQIFLDNIPKFKKGRHRRYRHNNVYSIEGKETCAVQTGLVFWCFFLRG